MIDCSVVNSSVVLTMVSVPIVMGVNVGTIPSIVTVTEFCADLVVVAFSLKYFSLISFNAPVYHKAINIAINIVRHIIMENIILYFMIFLLSCSIQISPS